MENKKDIFDHIQPTEIETPDSTYFENLADQVILSQKDETKVIPLYKKPIFWLSSAAASVLIIFMINFQSNNQVGSQVLLALNDIPTVDIRNYVEDNIEDFDVDLIVEYVPEEALTEEETPMDKIEDVAFENSNKVELQEVNEEEILQYFEEEEIDLLDILEDESFI